MSSSSSKPWKNKNQGEDRMEEMVKSERDKFAKPDPSKKSAVSSIMDKDVPEKIYEDQVAYWCGTYPDSPKQTVNLAGYGFHKYTEKVTDDEQNPEDSTGYVRAR